MTYQFRAKRDRSCMDLIVRHGKYGRKTEKLEFFGFNAIISLKLLNKYFN